jgi:hypothetical protein
MKIKKLPLLEDIKKLSVKLNESNKRKLMEAFDEEKHTRQDLKASHDEFGDVEIFAYTDEDGGVHIESAGVSGDVHIGSSDLKDAGIYSWVLKEAKKQLGIDEDASGSFTKEVDMDIQDFIDLNVFADKKGGYEFVVEGDLTMVYNIANGGQEHIATYNHKTNKYWSDNKAINEEIDQEKLKKDILAAYDEFGFEDVEVNIEEDNTVLVNSSHPDYDTIASGLHKGLNAIAEIKDTYTDIPDEGVQMVQISLNEALEDVSPEDKKRIKEINDKMESKDLEKDNTPEEIKELKKEFEALIGKYQLAIEEIYFIISPTNEEIGTVTQEERERIIWLNNQNEPATWDKKPSEEEDKANLKEFNDIVEKHQLTIPELTDIVQRNDETLHEKLIASIKPLNEKLGWTEYLKELGYCPKKFKDLDDHSHDYFMDLYKKSADASEFEQNYMSELEKHATKIKI